VQQVGVNDKKRFVCEIENARVCTCVRIVEMHVTFLREGLAMMQNRVNGKLLEAIKDSPSMRRTI